MNILIDAKTLDKREDIVLIKSLCTLEMEGNGFNLVKDIYKKNFK